MLFTSLVSFFAVMIIPDSARPQFLDNLIGGLSMYLLGPLPLRLAFHGVVVLVGVLLLSGAVNTAIIGSNGVLNRVAEDGVLPDWFPPPASPLRHHLAPHQHYRRPPVAHHSAHPRRRNHAGRSLRLRCRVELLDEGPVGSCLALQIPRKSPLEDAA